MMQNRKFERFTCKKSTTLPTKYPAWNAGLRQSRGFFVKSREELPAGNTALYKGRSLSNHKSYGV